MFSKNWFDLYVSIGAAKTSLQNSRVRMERTAQLWRERSREDERERDGGREGLLDREAGLFSLPPGQADVT